jgi:anti-sigma B factor antagonist
MHVLASSRAVIRPLQITGLWQLLQAEQVPADGRVSEGAGVA